MFNTLCEQLGQNIGIPETLKFSQSLHECFVDSFLQAIKDNPTIFFSNKNV